MTKAETFKVYEYPIKHPNGTTYNGSYTIRAEVKPLGYKDEVLVQTFTTTIPFTNFQVSERKQNQSQRLIFFTLDSGVVFSTDNKPLTVSNQACHNILVSSIFKFH